MSKPNSLLHELLHQSSVIEQAISHDELVFTIPVTATTDSNIEALDENKKAVDYIIRTQDY